MSKTRGELVVCDRCKDNSVFLKYEGEVGLSNYAGPGTRSKYENLPGTWIYDTHFGYLCPDCAEEFCTFLKEFFGVEKYERLAPAWKIEETENAD